MSIKNNKNRKLSPLKLAQIELNKEVKQAINQKMTKDNYVASKKFRGDTAQVILRLPKNYNFESLRPTFFSTRPTLEKEYALMYTIYGSTSSVEVKESEIPAAITVGKVSKRYPFTLNSKNCNKVFETLTPSAKAAICKIIVVGEPEEWNEAPIVAYFNKYLRAKYPTTRSNGGKTKFEESTNFIGALSGKHENGRLDYIKGNFYDHTTSAIVEEDKLTAFVKNNYWNSEKIFISVGVEMGDLLSSMYLSKLGIDLEGPDTEFSLWLEGATDVKTSYPNNKGVIFVEDSNLLEMERMIEFAKLINYFGKYWCSLEEHIIAMVYLFDHKNKYPFKNRSSVYDTEIQPSDIQGLDKELVKSARAKWNVKSSKPQKGANLAIKKLEPSNYIESFSLMKKSIEEANSDPKIVV